MMAESVECQACKNKGDPIMKTCSSCGGALIKTVDTIKPEKIAKLLFLLVIMALLIMLGIITLYWCNFGSLSIETKYWGEFGDYFGGTLNPILSFLSLIALLCTIVLQSKELELTRDELKRSADAQADTKNILDKQSETLARQQFESTFFSLLDQHNKVLEVLTANPTPEKFSRLQMIIRSIFLGKDITNLTSAKMALEKQNSVCGHYFRVLYQLLKFIATNTPGSEIGEAFEADKIQSSEVKANEKMYSNIVRSFLGYDITRLLAINCYCTSPEDTYWKYKLLIERYKFLEHLPFKAADKELPILKETINAYDNNAFGNSEFLRHLR